MLVLAGIPLAFATMTDPAWSAFTAVAVALIGGAALVLSEGVKTRRAAEEATTAARGAHSAASAAQATAEDARDLARPTGNGFATGVMERLDRIERAQRGIRTDVAQVRSDVGDVRDRITDHLQAHASADVAHRHPPT